MNVSQIIQKVNEEWIVSGCEFWKSVYFHHRRNLEDLTPEELFSIPYGYNILPIDDFGRDFETVKEECILLFYFFETELEKMSLSHEKFMMFYDKMDPMILQIMPDIAARGISEQEFLEQYQKLHIQKYGQQIEMGDCVNNYVNNLNDEF